MHYLLPFSLENILKIYIESQYVCVYTLFKFYHKFLKNEFVPHLITEKRQFSNMYAILLYEKKVIMLFQYILFKCT